MEQTNSNINVEELSIKPASKSKKKLFIIIGIVGGIIIIAAIVLIIIFATKKKDKKNESRIPSNPQTEEKLSTKSIELLIEGNNRRVRFLQDDEYKIQIFGNNFNEIKSDDATMLINGKNYTFEKYISLKENSPTKVEVIFSKNLTSFKEMFKGCDKIKNIKLKNIQTENISDISSMFEGCTNLNDIQFNNTNISNIIDSSKMFKGCSNLNKIEIEKFSTENVKDMSQMFYGCSNYEDNKFIEGLSTKNVESMNEIFSGCSKITSLNLSKFETSNVKNMSGMFKDMKNLKELEINSFNTEKVEYMNEMFESCSSIKKLDLSNFDTAKVINMEKMFSSCSELESIDLSSFNLKNCNNTDNMFYNTKEILLLSINNQNIMSKLNMSLKQAIGIIIEENMQNLERNLEEEKLQILGDSFKELNSSNALIYINGIKTNFSNFITYRPNNTTNIEIIFSKILTSFKEMFKGCDKIKNIKLKNIQTENISDISSMFEGCTNLNDIQFNNTNISNIIDSSKMFKGCSNLNKIEIEKFSTENVKDMSQMFYGCSNFENSTFIEGLSTKNVESMDEMFLGCSNIKSLNLSGYNTSNVKNMSGMFKGMSKLEKLNISSFNTEKVEYMNEMFESCSSMINLNLSNFNTEMVINMDRMFSSCINLEIVDLTSFALKRCNSTEFMFSNTTNKLLTSIKQNKEVMIKAGFSWIDDSIYDYSNDTKTYMDILFLIDATRPKSSAFKQIKENIIYITSNLMNKINMDKYDLSFASVFYRNSIDNLTNSHEIFDFNKIDSNFSNFIENILSYENTKGPEDWISVFNLSKNLSWHKNSFKFIFHIADISDSGSSFINYPSDENKFNDIMSYFAKNNFSIVEFIAEDYYLRTSHQRAQKIFRENGNLKFFIKINPTYEEEKEYFLDIFYELLQYALSAEILQGIDVSEELGNIDWKKVKEKNKIDFALLRAGIGYETDKKFEENYKGAKNVGIPIGVYWVSKSIDISEAIEENKNIANVMDKKQIEFPIYYVVEQEGFDREWDEIIGEFQFGTRKYIKGIKTTEERIRKYFDNDEFTNFHVWCSTPTENYPELNVDTYVWNYNNTGKIAGIEKDVPLIKSILNYTKITLKDY